jgi:Xaa-Pro aminopeptidase
LEDERPNPLLTLATSTGQEGRPKGVRVSRQEMERRWAAVRGAMEREGIDLLLTQANDGLFGGYVRYLTDIAAFSAIAVTVLFPRDGDSIVVTHGPNADLRLDPAEDGAWRGVGRGLTTPIYPTINYAVAHEQANVVKAMEPYRNARVGMLGRQSISASTLEAIQESWPDVDLFDATSVIDPIRAIKSAEEQELIRRTAALQDSAMQQVFDAIVPGMKERDVVIRAREITLTEGSDDGVFLCGSAPPGEPALPRFFRDSHRVIQEGDTIHLLIETNGPGGFCTHIVRTLVLGQAPERLLEEHAFALEAQQHTLDMLVPGAKPQEIWESHNAFLREHGRPEEQRIYCHGQGYDIMERPVVSAFDEMEIQTDMNIGCHPNYTYEDVYVWVCSNFLIGPDGPERLDKLPLEVFER